MLDKKDLFRDDVITQFETDNLQVIGWSQDEGYTTEALVESYPRRALYSGAFGGLFIVPGAIRRDIDHYCKGPVEGFKVLIHNPAEFPQVGMRYLRIPLMQEVLIMVQPNIMTTSKNLRSYSPQERHCYFPSERYLSFFKVYNQPNCEIECLTNYTWLECGCVALHMPRKEEMKICGPGKKKCMVDAQYKLRVSEINSAYKSEMMGSCDCLPACTSILYDGESTQADFNFHDVLRVYGEDVDAFLPYDASRVSVFFKDVQFTTSHRNELYGIVDFLANCGGLLGLFYGVSVLSFVELLYYSTLRLWANLKEIRRRSMS
ncbi:pickpocket protein 28 [Halyomorpha halys]|uniref:pickpocket protein 28 n=1 Tax=Halyomorpha halys TaxID=286706 RepID=UPI000D0C84CE|nr:pickpocket protein 28-like [Halyomorpha halys]